MRLIAPEVPADPVAARATGFGTLVAVSLALAACQPTVKVEPPKEPITINLNIKLDADVRVRLEEEAKEDVAANPEIF